MGLKIQCALNRQWGRQCVCITLNQTNLIVLLENHNHNHNAIPLTARSSNCVPLNNSVLACPKYRKLGLYEEMS